MAKHQLIIIKKKKLQDDVKAKQKIKAINRLIDALLIKRPNSHRQNRNFKNSSILLSKAKKNIIELGTNYKRRL